MLPQPSSPRNRNGRGHRPSARSNAINDMTTRQPQQRPVPLSHLSREVPPLLSRKYTIPDDFVGRTTSDHTRSGEYTRASRAHARLCGEVPCDALHPALDEAPLAVFPILVQRTPAARAENVHCAFRLLLARKRQHARLQRSCPAGPWRMGSRCSAKNAMGRAETRQASVGQERPQCRRETSKR
jgi:hypothetical protein